MRNSRKALASVAVVAMFALGACSQSPASPTGGADKPASPAASASPTDTAKPVSGELPAPFKDGKVKIAIVQNTGQGDYFQQFLNGVRLQTGELQVGLDVYDAQGDNATQATQLEQAIASGVQGIIVRHGFGDTLCPGVNKAIDMGIPIVIYDVEIQKCAPRAVQTQQSDNLMASLVLDLMAKQVPAGSDVGYVNVLGIAPLDRRDKVWKDYVAKNQWKQLFFTGTYTTSTATDTAPMVDAALKANTSVKAIYAPYDELTKGTLTALTQNPNLAGVKVYGADISTADIELMVADNSPWMGTGATDPNAIGATVTRTLFLQMAGQLNTLNVEFPPVLVTRDFLVEKNIKNMDDLRKAMPELNIGDVSSAPWIPSVKF